MKVPSSCSFVLFTAFVASLALAPGLAARPGATALDIFTITAAVAILGHAFTSVLDVNRYEDDALMGAKLAVEARVTGAPALVTSAGAPQGFHNQAAIGTFLDGR